MKVEYINISEILPYTNNARTHSEEQIKKIASSIKEFGFNNPILLDKDNIVIAGHGRLEAAKKIKIKEVPCIRLEHLTEAQKKAYILADNRLAEIGTSWDEELLSFELEGLKELDFDIGLTGFDDSFLNEPASEGLCGEDEVPEEVEPVCKIGDIWQLGRHRLMCGDSTDRNQVERLMCGEKADMIFTDPPYGMNFGGDRARGDHQKFKNRSGGIKAHGRILGDDLQGDSLISLVHDALASSLAYTKEGAPLYACFTWRTYAEFEAALQSLNKEVKACIVWDKKSIGIGHSHYRPQHEFIFYCGGQWHGDKSQSDVWSMSRGSTGEYVHPTQKPVELIERALNNSSKPGALVVDCFGGSGSTLIACEKTSRECCMIDLDPKYCDAIIKRWEDYTGKKAEFIENIGQA